MTQLPHATWLRTFEAAARHSSFSSAAEELNLTPAAVSQQIRLLEKHLGVHLFVRLPRGVSLTDVGQAYAQPIRKSFLEMHNATSGLFGSKKKSVVRVRSSISYAALVLAPQLHKFKELHPEIEVQLSTAVWSDRMDDETIDADIRYGAGDWPEQNIWQISRETAAVICHPDYLRSLGGAPSVQDIARAEVVKIIGSEIEWARLSDHFDLDLPPVKSWMKADSSLIALQIISAGKGAAILQDSFTKQYLDTGLLISPFEYQLPIRESYFLVVRDGQMIRTEVVSFRKWITSLQ
ncbi:LysR family transcriptional regulator [Roseovarius aestuarii]|uniref:Glycine cleavage system transcriptional activator n=1 Tax=Roseovarius aestuarii TaxID=475083 RepID=A0A1X7BM77_9RHOB|nr:LysR family transcriptional regulator [Roseovarius aestuarii]SMC10644.1 Glycine cleavage system transcriptional activator [Roseovarius aestuarii]